MLIEWKTFTGGPFTGMQMGNARLAKASSNGLLAINLGALRRNYRLLKGMAAPAECAAVVKANAYGLGIGPVVKALLNEDCTTFFVATLGEAKQVRAIAPGAVIYVFNGLLPGSAGEFAAADVRPVLNSPEEIREWAAYADDGLRPMPAAVHIDTGMNRLGLSTAEIVAVAREKSLLDAFPVSLAISHLACGDEPEHPKNLIQRDAFAGLAGLLPAARKSLSNSAGIFLGAPYHFDLVRPGIALYGGQFALNTPPLEPVVTLHGRIVQLRQALEGETVGYGAARKLKRASRIATVSVGYADGFARLLGSRSGGDGWAVNIEGWRAPILGRVSMDLMSVDITDIPDGIVERGGFAEIIGEHITVDDLASAAGTIGYEILTQLGSRYERVYTGL